MKFAWGFIKEAFEDWSEDRAARLAAALAYYTIFSLAPLLIVAIAIAGLAFGRDATQEQIVKARAQQGLAQQEPSHG